MTSHTTDMHPVHRIIAVCASVLIKIVQKNSYQFDLELLTHLLQFLRLLLWQLLDL